jgi:hypothetical protein
MPATLAGGGGGAVSLLSGLATGLPQRGWRGGVGETIYGLGLVRIPGDPGWEGILR